jgi:membrane-associated phospholipid phosphatase
MRHFLLKTFALCSAVILSPQVQALDSMTRNGNVLAVGLPAVAAGLTLANGDTEGLVQLIKSEGATLVIVEALKSSTHQTRPNGKDDKSFPSGHSAVAFSAAQFMQMKGGWEYGIPSYLAASYVANSRVEAREHRWRDVVAGAATGAMTTYYFTDDASQRRFGMTFTGKSGSFQFQQAFK